MDRWRSKYIARELSVNHKEPERSFAEIDE